MLISSSTAPAPPAPVEKKRKLKSSSKISQPNYTIPRLGLQTAVYGMKHKSEQIVPEDDDDNDNEEIGADTTVSNSVSDAWLKQQKTNRNEN